MFKKFFKWIKDWMTDINEYLYVFRTNRSSMRYAESQAILSDIKSSCKHPKFFVKFYNLIDRNENLISLILIFSLIIAVIILLEIK